MGKFAHFLLSLLLLFQISLSLFAQQKDTLYVDDLDPGYMETGGPWETGTDRLGRPHAGWGPTSRQVRLDDPTNLGQTARWTPTITKAGYYAVYFILPKTGEGRNRALYVVHSFAAPPDSQRHDQNKNSGHWIMLGIYNFNVGTEGYVEVINDDVSTFGYKFKADAIRLVSCPDVRDIEPVRRNLYNFGEVNIGSYKDWILRIYNLGGTNLTIHRIYSGTNKYTVTSPSFPHEVGPRQYVDVTVRFTPDFEKAFPDTLWIDSDDLDEPHLGIPVTGTGTAITVIVNNDDGYPYYMEHLGTWYNSNGAAVIEGIDNPTSRYAWLSESPNARAEFVPDIPKSGLYSIYEVLPATTNAATHALYEVHPFGSAVDSVWLDQNSGNRPDWWKLIGTYYLFEGMLNSVYVVNDGTSGGHVLRADLMKFTTVSSVADIAITEYLHRFVDVPIHTTSYWSFTINNLGNAELEITRITTQTPYFEVGSPAVFPITIPPLDSLRVLVGFTPEEIREYRDTLVVYSNDIDEPEIPVYLEGNGIGVQLIVDDSDTSLYEEGPTDTTWHYSTSTYGVNRTSRWTDKYLNPGAWAKWMITAPQTMDYEVYASAVPSENATEHAPYVIQVIGQRPDTVVVNQSSTSSANIWLFLGTYRFIAGVSTWVMVVNDTLFTYQDPRPVLRADAVKITEPGVSAVRLSSFYTSFEGGHVVIYWSTSYEHNLLGFNLYRTSREDLRPLEKHRLNKELIRGKSPYRFVDRTARWGEVYYYWLEDVDVTGRTVLHGPVSVTYSQVTPRIYALYQNYPNPFRLGDIRSPQTIIKYELPRPSEVSIQIYNLLGQRVRTLIEKRQAPGVYSLTWDGKDDRGIPVSSGVYFLQMQAGRKGQVHFRKVIKMAIIR